MATTSDFSDFARAFVADAGARGPFPEWSEAQTRSLLGRELPPFTQFVREFMRTSFDDGILRFVPPDRIVSWNSSEGWRAGWRAWPHFVVFAIDWRGRLFGVDLERVRSDPRVGMLDPAQGELFESDATFLSFINTEIVAFRDEVLDADEYGRWRASGRPCPGEQECVGYVEPLFLGGDASFANMSVTDVDVYVVLSGQLHAQVAHMPEGAPIGKVTIS